jgi:hypothetical protein
MLQRCHAGRARRLSRAILVTALGLAAVPAWSQAQDAAADALLAIDLNRATVIDRIVMQWGGLPLPSGAVLDAAQLRTRLSGLRADRLLAASLAGTPQGLQQVLSQATATMRRDSRLKSVGDAAIDLTYTPLTPCRIIDTRNAVGPLQPGVTRTEAGYTATTFADQGGEASNCGIPAGVAALALNVVAVNPTNLGFIKLWPANAAQPNASTINYDPTTINIATGTIVPVDGANNNSFNAESPAQVQMVVDVVGYFAAPSGTGGKFFMQGGNAYGTTAVLGTLDNQSISVIANGQPVARYLPNATSPNVVLGHANNAVSSSFGQTIGGGGEAGATCFDPITSMRSCGNQTLGAFATIAGGFGNQATGASFIGGGTSNTANSNAGTVGGGLRNFVAGAAATVPGGYNNIAGGDYSFAAGRNATADQSSCVVFGLWSSGSSSCLGTSNVFKVMGDNGFSVDYHVPVGGGGDRWLAVGPFSQFGVPATIITWNHAYLSDAGVWVNASSSKSLKTDFDDVDVNAVLDKVMRLPITTWRYKQGEGTIRHIGPMAEDFWAAFRVGYGEWTIADLDARGVALAAIQGLNAKVDRGRAAFEARWAEKNAKLESQQRRITELEAHLKELESMRDELDAVKRALWQLTGGDGRVAMHGTP